MIFCPKCGEAIPDDSIVCPKCGEQIKNKEDEQAVVYAPQKVTETSEKVAEGANNKPYFIWGGLAVLALIFLKLNYMSVSIDFYFGGSSDADYSGYYLTKCLEGTARLSGIMVIILIIIALASLATAAIGIKGGIVKKFMLKTILLVETVGYVLVTVVPYFHIKSLLEEFDSSLATTAVGPGCYLNIAVAVICVVIYFKCFSTNLKD